MSQPADVGNIAPRIKCNGREVTDAWNNQLLSMRIERALNLVGRARLRFADKNFTLSQSSDMELGTTVSVELPKGGLLFSGTVTGVALEHAGRAADLIVTVDDDAYKFTRHSVVEARVNVTYTDVIKLIAQHNGITADVEATDDVMEYLLQAGSDMAYLERIVERTGLSWWIEPSSSGQQLVVKTVKPSSPKISLNWAQSNLIDLSVRASALRPTEVVVKGWDPAGQAAVVGQKTPDAGEPPNLVHLYAGTNPTSKLAPARTSVSALSTLTSSEAATAAQALADEWASAAVVASGTLAEVNGGLTLGDTLAISDAGPASGNYLVTEIEHIYDSTGFVTRFGSGPRRPAGLVDTLGSASAAAAGFAVSGLMAGVVTDNKDPDSLGRVKVKFPGLSDEVASTWARMLTLGGGSARGAVFAPEVNDEVLVGFELGDTRRPVVLGGLFSAKNALPTGNTVGGDGKVEYRRFTSRKNNIVEFGDGEDAATQHILLQLGPVAHKLRLGADAFDIEVAAGKPVTVKAGSAKFAMDAQGNITMEGNNITLKANGNLDLQATANATVKANAQTEVQGSMVAVKGQAGASLESTGMTSVKGLPVKLN